MRDFPSRKKIFLKQALAELLLILISSLTLAKFTQNFILIISLALVFALARSYFYLYKIFSTFKTSGLFSQKTKLTYATIFQHLNFIQREMAFDKRVYLKLLANIRSYLYNIKLPIMIIDKDANLIWKNAATKKLLHLENSEQIKTKLINKLNPRVKKNPTKLKLRTKIHKLYLDLHIFKLQEGFFFIILEDFSFYKKIQKFQVKNMQLLQNELKVAVAKNQDLINSLASASHISKNSLEDMQENYTDIKKIIEKLSY